MYCGLSVPKLRTVRGSTQQTPPEPPMFLENFLYWLTDCSLTLSGLSAIHLRQTTRDNGVSGQISNPTGGPSGPPLRTVRSSLFQSTRDDNVSGQNTRLYGGLSALQ